MSKTLAGTRKRISEPHEGIGTIPTSLAALNKRLSQSEPMVPAESALCWAKARSARSWASSASSPAIRKTGKAIRSPVRRDSSSTVLSTQLASVQVVRHQRGQAFQARREGLRRLHQKPTVGEVMRYRWWLLKELEFVALGAMAALALSSAPVTIGRSRGPAQFGRLPGFITVHPSYLLRIRDADDRTAAYNDFVRDLRSARCLAQA